MRGFTLLPLIALMACTNGGEDTGPTGPTDQDGDGFYGQSDCDDEDPDVYPGAEEACDDEIDNDCDGEVDEGKTTFYEDRDEDGYGDPDKTVLSCTKPGKAYSKVADDCNDLDAAINPEQSERCETVGVDDDCDGEVDEDDATDLTTFYLDYDGDGYGGADIELQQCGSTPPANYSSTADDCDDTDALVNPGAEEVCDDGIDNDCDVSSDAVCDFSGKVRFEEANGRLFGASPSEGAGTGVASGDLDGDGVPDLIISATGGAGTVYVVRGPVHGPIGLEHADATVTGVDTGDMAGYAVSSGGDVNGDGYDDMLVGAPEANSDGSTPSGGLTYLVMGPVEDGSFGDAHATFAGESSGDRSGAFVSIAGDIDGDGLDDMLIGAPNSNAFSSDSGAAYLVLGPVTGDIDLTDAEAIVEGEAQTNYLGPVAGAGDVDGDGNDDVLAGGHGNGTGIDSERGRAYLFLGPFAGELNADDADTIYTGELGKGTDQSGDRAGYAVSSAGDVDGDGLSDVAVGAPGEDEGGERAGAVYVVTQVGLSKNLANADAKLVGPARDVYAGSFIAPVGDVNGDGNPDLLVGSGDPEGDFDPDQEQVKAFLVLGPMSGTVQLADADAIFLANDAGQDIKTTAVSGVGDIDGDGKSDVLVGAVGDDTAGTDAGAAYLFLGQGL